MPLSRNIQLRLKIGLKLEWFGLIVKEVRLLLSGDE
jgi:hypothetical protein